MSYKTLKLDEDVYNVLHELRYDYRERSLSAALRHMFHELGIEPYDEGDYDGE